MKSPPAIDLINYRIPDETQKNRVYDSLENRQTNNERSIKSTIVFDDVPRKFTYLNTNASAPNSDYRTDVDNTGRIYETSKAIKESRKQVFSHAEKYGSIKVKRRLDTPTMNRVMDNTHFVIPTTSNGLKDSLPYGNLPWSNNKTSRFNEETTSLIGPGYYNVAEALDRNVRYPSVKFSDSPGLVEGIEDVDLSHLTDDYYKKLVYTNIDRRNDRVRYKNGIENKASPNDAERVDTSATPDSNIYEQNGNGVKWSDVNRWNDPMNKQQPFIKTNGMKLDQDYDKFLNKKYFRPFSTGERFDSSAPQIDGRVYKLEGLPKPTIAMALELSPIKYSSAFRSKAPQGMQVVATASSTIETPYTNAFQSSIVIKHPNKMSPSFLNPRTSCFDDLCASRAKSTMKYTVFSEVNSNGITFTKASKTAGRNMHMEKMLREKLTQIYPRLARIKFGKKTNVEV